MNEILKFCAVPFYEARIIVNIVALHSKTLVEIVLEYERTKITVRNGIVRIQFEF